MNDQKIADATDGAKLRALAEFAAGAGHEINNPLATIIGYAQQLLTGETDLERRRMLETIGAQAYRIRDMIGDAMLFARPPQPKPVGLKLAEVLEEVIGKFRSEADERRIALHLDVAPDVGILADPVQLRVVISSLLRNSFEAVSDGASITIESSTATHGGRRFARLVVRDSGRGFSEQDREHLFDPFYSGRQAGRGLGFGLSKCWRIVTLHGGEILAATPEKGGAEFTVLWPGE